MADFTGMTVKVTLKPPSNMVLQGKVKDIIPGQLLTLQNVYFLHNGSQLQEYSIRGPTIADLQVVDPNAAPLPTPAIHTSVPPSNIPRPETSATPQRQQSGFVDPAILSYARSPAPTKSLARPPDPATPVKSMLAKAAENLPLSSHSPFIGEAGKSSESFKENRSEDAVQPLRQMSGQDLPMAASKAVHDGEQPETATKKKARRSQKKKLPLSPQLPAPVMNVEVSRNGNDMNGSVQRGQGWRQTPLLQPTPKTSSPLHLNPVAKSRKKRETQQNGWATEEATDIQDLGDFDFEASNNLFDKAQVFSELRQGDTTADEDRLVSHNKVNHRPGTYGGKNLHPTENVLSPKLKAADTSSDADTELNFPNGRSSSRHSASRAAIRTLSGRQNSAQLDGNRAHPLSASMSSGRGGGALQRSGTSVSGKLSATIPSIATSPMPVRTRSPVSATSISGTTVPESHFTVKSTLTPCPVLHPSALETLEAETTARYGLTGEAISEAAARSISETAMQMHASSSRRGSRSDTVRGGRQSTTTLEAQSQRGATHPDPVIVIIAGHHTVGARAIAAARHLVSRNAEIILAETQPSKIDSRNVQYQTQLAMLKRMIKGGANIKRGSWRRSFNHIKNLSGPPAIIIDALLAGETYSSLSEYSEQAPIDAREMIEWANRSRAPVLSIACPSGVSGIDGSAPVVEGEPLAVRPDKVLSLGAPMLGLLEAANAGERWDVALADVGINIALRREEAVDFGAQWIVDLTFVARESGS